MKIKATISVITLCTLIGTGVMFVYNVFAKEKEFKEFKQTQQAELNEFKEEYLFDKLTNRRNAIQERMWKLEDRYGVGFVNNTSIDPIVRQSYRELKREYEDIGNKIKENYK